jgi:uncharacterized membrane protein
MSFMGYVAIFFISIFCMAIILIGMTLVFMAFNYIFSRENALFQIILMIVALAMLITICTFFISDTVAIVGTDWLRSIIEFVKSV